MESMHHTLLVDDVIRDVTVACCVLVAAAMVYRHDRAWSPRICHSYLVNCITGLVAVKCGFPAKVTIDHVVWLYKL